MSPITADGAPPIMQDRAGQDQLASWAIVVLIVLVAVIVRAPYLGDPAADYDEQLYSVIGQGWLDGQLPYRDMWDRKPPGLFALFAAMHWIGGPTSLAYQIPGLACTIAAALMLFSLAQKIGTRFGALTVSVLFVVNLPIFILHLGQSETFLMPILLGQLMLLRKAFTTNNPRRIHMFLCALMLLGGLSLQIKYSVLPFCVMLALMAVIRLHQIGLRRIHIAMWLMGYGLFGVLPTGIFALYFMVNGAFDEFVFANFISIFKRGEVENARVYRFAFHIAVAAFPLVIFAGLGIFSALKNRPRIDQATLYLSVAGAAAGTVSLLMLGAAFIHYFGPLLPFLCILATSFFSFHGSHRLFAGLAIFLAVISASVDEQIERTLSSRSAIPQLLSVIDTYVPKHECVFVFDGPTVIYTSTRRCAQTRLVFPDHFVSLHEQSALDVDPATEVKNVMKELPGAVIVSDELDSKRFIAASRKTIKDAIIKDYVLAERVFLYPRNSELYIRADLVPSPPKLSKVVPCAVTRDGLCKMFTKFSEKTQ